MKQVTMRTALKLRVVVQIIAAIASAMAAIHQLLRKSSDGGGRCSSSALPSAGCSIPQNIGLYVIDV